MCRYPGSLCSTVHHHSQSTLVPKALRKHLWWSPPCHILHSDYNYAGHPFRLLDYGLSVWKPRVTDHCQCLHCDAGTFRHCYSCTVEFCLQPIHRVSNLHAVGLERNRKSYDLCPSKGLQVCNWGCRITRNSTWQRRGELLKLSFRQVQRSSIFDQPLWAQVPREGPH